MAVVADGENNLTHCKRIACGERISTFDRMTSAALFGRYLLHGIIRRLQTIILVQPTDYVELHRSYRKEIMELLAAFMPGQWSVLLSTFSTVQRSVYSGLVNH
jgi:hypothetical protein